MDDSAHERERAAKPSERRTHGRVLRALLGLLLVALALAFFASGLREQLTIEGVRRAVAGRGALGAAGFVLAFTLLAPIGVSGHLFAIGASVVWPAPLAFALSLSGALLSQTLGFTVVRYFLHDFAQARIPARLRRYEQALILRPVRAVLALRLLTFTGPIATAALAVSRVRVLPMLLGTCLGLMPMLAVDVWLGELALRWFFSSSAGETSERPNEKEKQPERGRGPREPGAAKATVSDDAHR